MEKNKRIYLDVCVLSRPYDDQSFLRIRIETEAANLILSKVDIGLFNLISSPVHLEEISSISDTFERHELLGRLERLAKTVNINVEKTKERAEELYRLNFSVADAAHVAYAEKSGAEFISCDDALLKNATGTTFKSGVEHQ